MVDSNPKPVTIAHTLAESLPDTRPDYVELPRKQREPITPEPKPVKQAIIDKVPFCSMNTYYCCCYCCVRRVHLREPENRIVDTIGSHVFSPGGWIHIGQLEYRSSHDRWIIEHDATDPATTYCYPCCLLQVICCSIGYELCGCSKLCGEEEFPWVLDITG